MNRLHAARKYYLRKKFLTGCMLFGMSIAKCNGAMVVICGTSSRSGRGMVGMFPCSHASFRVFNQCNTAGDVKT